MKLKPGQLCPLHRKRNCCRDQTGERKPSWKMKQVAPGVRRQEDPYHPRGYRELRSPAALRELVNRKLVEQDGKCCVCGELMEDYRDIVAEHLQPRGMGGARRDDHPSNIGAAHAGCNLRKGSKR